MGLILPLIAGDHTRVSTTRRSTTREIGSCTVGTQDWIGPDRCGRSGKGK